MEMTLSDGNIKTFEVSGVTGPVGGLMCALLFPTNPLLLGPSEQVPRDAIPCCLHTERNGRLGKEEHFKTHGLSLTKAAFIL